MSTPEQPDHVPDPTAMSGTLETTGIGGGRHSRLEGVVGVFAGPPLPPALPEPEEAPEEAPEEPVELTKGASQEEDAAPETQQPPTESAPAESEDGAVTNEDDPSEVTEDPTTEEPVKAPAGRRTTKKMASASDAKK